MASEAAPRLEAVGLTGERGGRRLFANLNFRLEPGRLVWLRGRNGRGKTSLLRLLAGLATPAAGEVRCDDQPLRRATADWRARLVFVAHANALKEDLSVAESLRFLAQLQGLSPAPSEISRALDQLGVAPLAQRPVRTLSQGQRRRASLARLALPRRSAAWLLDEPFDALDDDGIARLNRLLAEHAERGGSAMLTSHQPLRQLASQPQVLDLDTLMLPG